jgi:Conserved TM helix/Mechanosensitive ion channel
MGHLRSKWPILYLAGWVFFLKTHWLRTLWPFLDGKPSMILLFGWYDTIVTPIQDGLISQFVTGMSTGIPKFISAVIILMIGIGIARVLRRVITKTLRAIGLDRLTGRLNDIDLVKSTGREIQLSSLIAQVVYFMVVLMFAMMTVDVLQIKVLSDLMKDLFNYLPSLLTAGVVLLFGLFFADILRGITLSACQSLGIPSAKAIAGVVFYFVFVSVAVSALSQAKIQTGFISNNLTAVIAAGALAFAIGYGLAAKDLAANYLGGYYNKSKVRVGDEVIIGTDRGKVVLIDNTSLILQTHDRAIVIPLSKLTTDKIEIFYPDPQEERLIDDGTRLS